MKSALLYLASPLLLSGQLLCMEKTLTLPKGRIGLGVVPSLCSQAIQHASAGSIKGLCTIKNTTTALCLVNAKIHASVSKARNTITEAEELIKLILLPQLNTWSQSTEPVLLLLPHSRIAPENCNGFLADISRKPNLKRVLQDKESFPLLVVLGLVAHASEGRYRNLSFRFGEEEFSLPMSIGITAVHSLSMGTLASKARQAGLSKTINDTWDINKLDASIRRSPLDEQSFFSKNGPYELLKKAYFADDSSITLAQFLAELDAIEEKVHRLVAVTDSEAFTVQANAYLDLLGRKRKQLPPYFSSYANAWKQMSLLKFLFTLIEHHKSFNAAVTEFRCALDQIADEYQTLYAFSSILRGMKEYQQIVVLTELDNRLCSLFSPKEFTILKEGEINENSIELSIRSSVFYPAYIQNYFAHLFGFTHQAPFSEDNPFELFMPKKEYLQPASSIKMLPFAEVKPLYISRGDISEQAFLNYSKTECAFCQTSLPSFDALLLLDNKKCLCSLPCLRTTFLKQCSQLTALLGNQEKNEEDTLVLQQLAALCYLKYLTLSSFHCNPDGLYGELNHLLLDTKLNAINANSSDTRWKKTCQLAAECGIDIKQLWIQNSHYIRLKKEYYKALLTRAKHRRYQDLSFDLPPEFDPKGHLRILQEREYKLLTKHFNARNEVSSISFAGLYYELMNHISSMVSFSPDALEELLTIKEEATSESLDKLLAWFIPQKKNSEFFIPKHAPEKATKPTPEKVPQEEPSEEASEEADALKPTIATATIPCRLAEQIPYTITLFHIKPFMPLEEQTGASLWATHGPLKPSYRIRTIIALADSIKDEAEIIPTPYGSFMFNCTDTDYDSSIREKLDLHHLYPFIIDQYVHRYGVAEQKDDLVQVSLPGIIRYSDGTAEEGFFQLSYIPESWICIHRCFKRYLGQKSEYVSPALANMLQLAKNSTGL